MRIGGLESLLRDPVIAAQDYVRIKARIAFSSKLYDKFDQGVLELLQELGPNPVYAPESILSIDPVIVTACDTEKSDQPELLRGLMEVGVKVDVLPDDVSVPLLLALASYLAVFNNVHEFVLLDISLPERILTNGSFPGPKFGADFVPNDYSTKLGAIMKPRFANEEDYVRRFVRYAATSDLDYIFDDELSVGSSSLPSFRRVEVVMEELGRVRGKVPKYVTNITSDHRGALRRALDAKDLGADGAMLNVFAMGYDALADLATDAELNLGLVANGLGLGVLTRGPKFRLSTELVAKLSRLTGADAFYTGPIAGAIDSVDHSASHLIRSLTQPFGSECQRPPSAAVMAGGIGLPEVIQNDSAYSGPLFLTLGYRFTEFMIADIPGQIVVECIRETMLSCHDGGIEAGRQTVERLLKKGDKYRACILSLDAEKALSR